MRVIVMQGDVEVFSYDTDNAAQCLHPGQEDLPDVVCALDEALAFLVPEDTQFNG